MLAAIAAAAVLPTPVFAEHAVGLEAQGVDPWASLHNSQGLDVRDALGRPVRAEVITRQLGAAAAHELAQKAVLSSLPKARVIFQLLDRLPDLTGYWGLPFPLVPARGVWALPLPLRSAQKAAGLGAFVCALATVLTLGCCRTQTASSCSFKTTLVLRC
jgi:hypothetical protein